MDGTLLLPFSLITSYVLLLTKKKILSRSLYHLAGVCISIDDIPTKNNQNKYSNSQVAF